MNFISLLINKNLKSFMLNVTLRKDKFILLLNNINYYIFFKILKFSSLFKLETLSDLTVSHYPDNVFEYELNYFLLSYKLNFRVWSKLYFRKDSLIVSLIELYINANWLERELFDLFGVKFIYHNDLRRILTDYGFIGHPMLKLFPLVGFLELRYDDIISKIIKETVELMQAYRIFSFINPWNFWHK